MTLGAFIKALGFAAHAHRTQVRKGTGEPYVNHLIEVAEILARVAEVDDVEVLSAAVLHDVIEDTPVGAAEVEQQFGPRVRSLVEALTDDRELPKVERKRLQIEHMRDATNDVRRIKLADHCSNVAALPEVWPEERRREYLDWSEKVAQACSGAHPALECEYQARMKLARAKLNGDV
jgi:guanosine-3',5'-bis(diphosphate) 3'-pyrophosphohydrolase